jgi:hypothetical protein
MRSISILFVDSGRIRAFLKELGNNPSTNQLKIMMRLLTGQCHLKGPVLKLGFIDTPRCN